MSPQWGKRKVSIMVTFPYLSALAPPASQVKSMRQTCGLPTESKIRLTSATKQSHVNIIMTVIIIKLECNETGHS